MLLSFPACFPNPSVDPSTWFVLPQLLRSVAPMPGAVSIVGLDGALAAKEIVGRAPGERDVPTVWLWTAPLRAPDATSLGPTVMIVEVF